MLREHAWCGSNTAGRGAASAFCFRFATAIPQLANTHRLPPFPPRVSSPCIALQATATPAPFSAGKTTHDMLRAGYGLLTAPAEFTVPTYSFRWGPSVIWCFDLVICMVGWWCFRLIG